MLIKLLSSNWIAIPVFVLACFAVLVLYLRGRTTEAKIGGAVLVLAAVLIFWGSRGNSSNIKD